MSFGSQMFNNMFKHKKDHTRYMYLHPAILMILFDAQNWALERNIPFLVTETVTTKEEDDKLSRISSSHRQGRAFDLSVRGWSTKDINEFRTYFSRKYIEYAALTKSSGQPSLVIYHDSGHGAHIHVQIHSKYAQEITFLADI